MIKAAGMDAEDYVTETAKSFSFRTSATVGDSDTRIVAMPDLPAHSGGYTAGDEIMVNVRLSGEVTFISGAPEGSASVIVRNGMLPESVVADLEGRQVRDLIDHPMFDLDGLFVRSVEPGGPTAPGCIRLRLCDRPWTKVRVRPDPMPGMTPPPREHG